MANRIKCGTKVIWHHGDPCEVKEGTLQKYHIDNESSMTGAGLVFGAGRRALVVDAEGVSYDLPPAAIRKSTSTNRTTMTLQAVRMNTARAERRRLNGTQP